MRGAVCMVRRIVLDWVYAHWMLLMLDLCSMSWSLVLGIRRGERVASEF